MKADHGYAAGKWRTDEPPRDKTVILAVFQHSKENENAPKVMLVWYGPFHQKWYQSGSLWEFDYDPVKWAYIYDENEPVSEGAES